MMLFMSTSADTIARETIGPAASILIGAVVCCAAAVSGDNMQVQTTNNHSFLSNFSPILLVRLLLVTS